VKRHISLFIAKPWLDGEKKLGKVPIRGAKKIKK
jgi:hypothetical protein